MRVPRAPLSPPDPPSKLNSAIRQIASQPGVIVLDDHLFNQIEHPHYFWDGWHLNREGMDLFSEILAKAVRQALGPPRTDAMLFNTPQFFVFLAVVLVLFYTAPRSWRKYILLAASYFFYMSWIPKFILLLLTLTVIDYTAARWIAGTSRRARARRR